MNTNSTVELLDRARIACGNVTDYRMAKLLGVRHATVSTWRTGRSQMSPDLITKVAYLAGEEPLYWYLRIAAESATPGPGRDMLHLAAEQADKVREPGARVPGDSLVRALMLLRKNAAAVILAAVAVCGTSAAPVNSARAESAPVGDDLYIMRSLLRRKRIRRRLELH